MKYFILGGDASGAYSDTDFSKKKQVRGLAEQIDDCGALEKFDDLEDPSKVIEASTGWDDFVEITEEEYNTLSKMLITIHS